MSEIFPLLLNIFLINIVFILYHFSFLKNIFTDLIVWFIMGAAASVQLAYQDAILWFRQVRPKYAFPRHAK